MTDQRGGANQSQAAESEIPLPEPNALARFLDAAKGGDNYGALSICQKTRSDPSWVGLVFAAAEKLEGDWRSDSIGFEELTEAFRVIRWVIDELRVGSGLSSVFSGHSGACLIYIPEGERHTFGAQILAYKMEAFDWQVEIMEDQPINALLRRLEHDRVDVLGLSIGYDQNLQGMADLISAARVSSLNPSLKVMVGGNVFSGVTAAYDFLGADFVIRDGDEALSMLMPQATRKGS